MKASSVKPRECRLTVFLLLLMNSRLCCPQGELWAGWGSSLWGGVRIESERLELGKSRGKGWDGEGGFTNWRITDAGGWSKWCVHRLGRLHCQLEGTWGQGCTDYLLHWNQEASAGRNCLLFVLQLRGWPSREEVGCLQLGKGVGSLWHSDQRWERDFSVRFPGDTLRVVGVGVTERREKA